MAREILFKAKRIGDGKWIEGDLIKRAHYDEVTYYIGFIEMTSLSKAQVIPETVSQFTGLYDKNGVRIFEGDIVYYDGSCYKVVFESRNGAGYFGIVVGENETWGFGNSTPAYMMVVVGNIYDNPDLLEVSKE